MTDRRIASRSSLWAAAFYERCDVGSPATLPGGLETLCEHAIETAVETVRRRGRTAANLSSTAVVAVRSALGTWVRVNAVGLAALPVLHRPPQVVDVDRLRYRLVEDVQLLGLSLEWLRRGLAWLLSGRAADSDELALVPGLSITH
jgi:hypothetical protein